MQRAARICRERMIESTVRQEEVELLYPEKCFFLISVQAKAENDRKDDAIEPWHPFLHVTPEPHIRLAGRGVGFGIERL